MIFRRAASLERGNVVFLHRDRDRLRVKDFEYDTHDVLKVVLTLESMVAPSKTSTVTLHPHDYVEIAPPEA